MSRSNSWSETQNLQLIALPHRAQNVIDIHYNNSIFSCRFSWFVRFGRGRIRRRRVGGCGRWYTRDSGSRQLRGPTTTAWGTFYHFLKSYSADVLIAKRFIQVDGLTAISAYSKLKFIDYFGTDKHGQHIFAIYACRLPPRQDLNGNLFIEYGIEQ